MGNILEQAIRDWDEQRLRDLGWGFLGNITGVGYKCDEVYDFLQARMQGYMSAMEHNGLQFDDYDFTGLYAGGIVTYLTGIPNDYSPTQHIYIGIMDKRTGEVVAFADPWRADRYARFQPDELDPNTGNIQLRPWNTVLPSPPPPPPDPYPWPDPGDLPYTP